MNVIEMYAFRTQKKVLQILEEVIIVSHFHKTEITRGVYGELSKVQEELDEAVDAEAQGQDLMLLVELSDIVGAVAGVASKYGMSIEQLVTFSKLRSEVAIKWVKEGGKN